MLRALLDSPRAFFFSLLVHVALIAVLTVSFDWTPKPMQLPRRPQAVQAIVVDEAKVRAELEKLRENRQRERSQQEARARALERRAQEAEAKRKQEERQLAELQHRRAEQERVRKADAAKLERQQRERKAAAKEKAEQARRQAAIEAKRKAKRKAELEAQRKKEAERKRKAEQAKRRAAQAQRLEEEARKRREAELRAQLEAEEGARRDAEAQREIARYVVLIKGKVTRNWLRPAGSDRGLACTVRVRIIPGGDVVSAQVVSSSGNDIFDRSVETAVLKSSPLPFPTSPALVERMREIDFVFRPEG